VEHSAFAKIVIEKVFLPEGIDEKTILEKFFVLSDVTEYHPLPIERYIEIHGINAIFSISNKYSLGKTRFRRMARRWKRHLPPVFHTYELHSDNSKFLEKAPRLKKIKVNGELTRDAYIYKTLKI
jgi:hypothetical protein